MNWKNKRVLVTGGAGFIGSGLAAKLVEAGAFVTVLDNLFTGFRESVPPAAIFEEWDVTSFAIRPLVYDADIVFHLAARNIIVSTDNPHEDMQTNIGGTLNILGAAANMKSKPRVVLASSASVYGNRLDASEDHDSADPHSPYSISKLAAEYYALYYQKTHSVPVSILRYSNIYGPGQTPDNPYCGVIGKWMNAIRHHQPIERYGDGMYVRDYTYIDDAVRATMLAASEPAAVGEILNISTGFGTTGHSLALKLAEVCERPVEIIARPPRDIDSISHRSCWPEKAREVLGWKAEITLDEGLKRTWAWQNK